MEILKKYFALLGMLAFLLTISSGVASEEKATLVVFRGAKSVPFMFKPMIRINGTPAFYLPRGYHAELELEAGEYLIESDWKAAHGAPDREISVVLEPGKRTFVQLKSALEGFGSATSIGSDLEQATSSMNLSKSRKVTRYQPAWVESGVGGFLPEPTKNERYGLSLDTELAVGDFESGNDEEKLQLVRYLMRLEYFDESILFEIEQYILNNYKRPLEKKADVQVLAFACKYLGSSRMLEFQPTLEEVATNAYAKPLRRYAKGYLESFFGVKLGDK